MAFARINYFSRSLQKASSVSVVFPDDPAMPRPWSVFYLLHGLSDDDTIWMRRTSIERYVEGLPLVRGHARRRPGLVHQRRDRLRLRRRPDQGRRRTVDRTFPVKAERSGRAIGGLSMGGYGAVKLGLKHHEMLRQRQLATPARWRSSTRTTTRTTGSRTWAQSSIGSSASRPGGDRKTPSPSSSGSTTAAFPAMRIDCGKADFLLEQNRAFHRHLETHAHPP